MTRQISEWTEHDRSIARLHITNGAKESHELFFGEHPVIDRFKQELLPDLLDPNGFDLTEDILGAFLDRIMNVMDPVELDHLRVAIIPPMDERRALAACAREMRSAIGAPLIQRHQDEGRLVTHVKKVDDEARSDLGHVLEAWKVYRVDRGAMSDEDWEAWGAARYAAFENAKEPFLRLAQKVEGVSVEAPFNNWRLVAGLPSVGFYGFKIRDMFNAHEQTAQGLLFPFEEAWRQRLIHNDEAADVLALLNAGGLQAADPWELTVLSAAHGWNISTLTCGTLKDATNTDLWPYGLLDFNRTRPRGEGCTSYPVAYRTQNLHSRWSFVPVLRMDLSR